MWAYLTALDKVYNSSILHVLEGKDIVNVSIYFMVVSGDRLRVFHLMSRVLIFQCLPLIRVLSVQPSALKECIEILQSSALQKSTSILKRQ